MKKLASLFFGLFLIQSLYAQKVYTPETVPNPTVGGGGYVSNPDDVLKGEDVAELNSIISEINDSTTAQIGIAVINSIGNETPETFAYQLFNRWGIGQKDKNNGLLVLLVMDQHAWKIETGYGLEGVLPDALCKRIGDKTMVPYFKEGDFGKGLIEGIKEIKAVLENPAYADEIRSDMDESVSETSEPDYSILWFVIGGNLLTLFITGMLYRKDKLSGSVAFPIFFFCIAFIVLFLVLTLGFEITSLLKPFNTFIFLYICVSLLVLLIRTNKNGSIREGKEDALIRYEKTKKDHGAWFLALLIFPVTFLFYYIWYASWIMKQKKRFAPRIGKTTGKPLRRLTEKEDDKYLKKEQLTEEQIDSIDYDVWVSDDLKDVEILEYINSYSGYSSCPECDRRTKFSNNKVISEATYSSSGSGIRTYLCKNCSFRKEEHYTIPKKVKSSSSSGGSFGGGGSSFGGGSSGGGGAGGRW
jgi:uncharacterized protein